MPLPFFIKTKPGPCRLEFRDYSFFLVVLVDDFEPVKNLRNWGRSTAHRRRICLSQSHLFAGRALKLIKVVLVKVVANIVATFFIVIYIGLESQIFVNSVKLLCDKGDFVLIVCCKCKVMSKSIMALITLVSLFSGQDRVP